MHPQIDLFPPLPPPMLPRTHPRPPLPPPMLLRIHPRLPHLLSSRPYINLLSLLLPLIHPYMGVLLSFLLIFLYADHFHHPLPLLRDIGLPLLPLLPDIGLPLPLLPLLLPPTTLSDTDLPPLPLPDTDLPPLPLLPAT